MAENRGSSLSTVLLVGLLMLIAGGAGTWFFLQQTEEDDSNPTQSSVPGETFQNFTLAPGEVFMEPAGTIGPNPFSQTAFAPTPNPTLAAPVVSQSTAIPAPQQVSVQSNSGAQVGLYGGSLNDSACDVAKLIAFLGADAAKAGAWMGALNADPTLRFEGGQITAANLATYINGLTPVVLLADTRVTNNGFLNGVATPRQSVFQKGTAVLIDKFGVPRARCFCGNPLLPPVPSTVQVTYVGPAWQGFNPSAIAVVTSAPQAQTTFQLLGPTGQTVQVPVGVNPSASAATQPGATASAVASAPAANTYPVQPATDSLGRISVSVPTGWETRTRYSSFYDGSQAYIYQEFFASPSLAVSANNDTFYSQPSVAVNQIWPAQPGQAVDPNAVREARKSGVCPQAGAPEQVTHPRFGSGLAVTYTDCRNYPTAQLRITYFPQPDGSLLEVRMGVLSEKDRNHIQTVLDTVKLPTVAAPAVPNVPSACSTTNSNAATLVVVNNTSGMIRMYPAFEAPTCGLDLIIIWPAGPGQSVTIPDNEGRKWVAVALDGSQVGSIDIPAGGGTLTLP